MSGYNSLVNKIPRTRYSSVDRVQLDCSADPGVTKKSMAAECDIYTILNRFNSTGVITHLNHNPVQFGFAEAIDFHSAMNMIREGEEAFMQLPHETRLRFDNDVTKFLDFVTDEKNTEEAQKLGLITQPTAATASAPSPAPTTPTTSANATS